MKQRTDSQGVPYSYLVDNIKVVLIFLVVFNHLIAFQLVKVDMVVRYVWYGITIFHMPAFIFIFICYNYFYDSRSRFLPIWEVIA